MNFENNVIMSRQVMELIGEMSGLASKLTLPSALNNNVEHYQCKQQGNKIIQLLQTLGLYAESNIYGPNIYGLNSYERDYTNSYVELDTDYKTCHTFEDVGNTSEMHISELDTNTVDVSYTFITGVPSQAPSPAPNQVPIQSESLHSNKKRTLTDHYSTTTTTTRPVDHNINYNQPKKPYPQYYYGDVIKVTDTYVSLTRTINGTDETYTKPISDFLQNPGTTKHAYRKEVLHKILHHCIEHDRVADRKIKIAKSGIRYNRKYGFDIFNEWISEINTRNHV